jgi:hypothetical protein
LCPSRGLVLESRDQQPAHPFVPLPGESWVGMYWNPDILPIAPDMIGQTDRHRWRPWRAPLAQALMGHHKVIEADPKPETSPVAGLAPGQTAGAAPQGGYQPTQRAIPSFHKSRRLRSL